MLQYMPYIVFLILIQNMNHWTKSKMKLWSTYKCKLLYFLFSFLSNCFIINIFYSRWQNLFLNMTWKCNKLGWYEQNFKLDFTVMLSLRLHFQKTPHTIWSIIIIYYSADYSLLVRSHSHKILLYSHYRSSFSRNYSWC